MPSNHLILCRPLLLMPSIFPNIRVFWNESALCIKWPKYWCYSFNIIPSKEIPGLISFRMDWWFLLAVQDTLKSLLQHHGSKASILQRSAFFTVQLSHSYMTTGKTIALTRWTLVGKVMSLLLNMLSRLVITFLLRSKHLFESNAYKIGFNMGMEGNFQIKISCLMTILHRIHTCIWICAYNCTYTCTHIHICNFKFRLHYLHHPLLPLRLPVFTATALETSMEKLIRFLHYHFPHCQSVVVRGTDEISQASDILLRI